MEGCPSAELSFTAARRDPDASFQRLSNSCSVGEPPAPFPDRTVEQDACSTDG